MSRGGTEKRETEKRETERKRETQNPKQAPD